MRDQTPVVGIVAAAGSGERMGVDGGKQLLAVARRPVAAWTTQALCDVDCIDEVIVVCDPARVADYAAQITPHIAGDNRAMFLRCGRETVETLRDYFATGRIVDKKLAFP